MNIQLFIYRKRYFILTLGGLFLLIGFLITGFWTPVFDKILVSKLSLANNSHTYDLWKETVFPLYMKFYLFHWTNPEESLAKTQKPNFIEKGPYIFREHRKKRILKWNTNGTITFNTLFNWHFLEDISNGSLSDNITNVNVVAVAVSSMLKNANVAEELIASLLIDYNEKSIYVTKTVGELLYDGYEDKLLKLIKKFGKQLHINVSSEKFGWWHGKNMSDNGILNMFTGENDINHIGELHSWNYKTELSKYSGNCDVVQGTTGEIWPKNNPSRSNATLFIPDLCGFFALSNDGSKDVYNVEGTSFVGLENIFDNGTEANSSHCYCQNSICDYATGVRNVSSCLNGTPAFISYPHFYLADDKYVTDISGMKSDKEKHEFHITLEKKTGITMEAYARLQINILLEPIEHIRMMKNVPKVMIPTVWFEQYAEMPPDFLHNIKFMVTTLPKILQYLGFTLLYFGTIFLTFGLIAIHMNYFDPTYQVFINAE